MKEKKIDELIEIYKIHVDITDKISDRRGKANQYYVSLLSAILVITGFYVKELGNNSFLKVELFLLIIGILGILLCILWWFNIRSYRQLNSGKFLTLHELEEELKFPFYKREWEILGEGKEMNKYFQLTRVEQISPLILSIPYMILSIYSVINL